MITLLIDGLIAVTKTVDRGLTAVEKNVRRRVSPRPVDGAPLDGAARGCAASAGPVEHPVDRTTSEVLTHAAAELFWYHSGFPPAVIRDLIAELRDRAAQLAAEGD